MKTTVSISGLRELDAALGELPKATGRAVLRRIGIRAFAPVIATAKQLVPVDKGELRDSLKVATKLSRRQQQKHARAVAEGKASVMLYAGATSLPHAHLVEYGTANMPPQPFMRPAWDQEKDGVLATIKAELGGEIEKAARRLAVRAARRTAKAAAVVV
jgi:HK97 gp10 family phage protein